MHGFKEAERDLGPSMYVSLATARPGVSREIAQLVHLFWYDCHNTECTVLSLQLENFGCERRAETTR